MVNLEWYRTFKAVYQTGSFTAAAKTLFISQPNVSQHLSALEAYIGKQLFERKPKLIPTEYGKLFYVQVIGALEELENVEERFAMKCIAEQVHALRIGTTKEYFDSIISKHVNNNTTCFSVTFGQTAELMRKMTKGELDFVVATQQTETKNIVYESILVEQFVIVANASLDTKELDESIDNKDWKTVEDWLGNQTWFAYDTILSTIRRFWLENFRKRPSIRARFIIPDMHAILNILGRSQGITIIARHLAEELIQEGILKEIWKGHTHTFNTLYLAYDKTKVTTTQIGYARELISININRNTLDK